MARNKVKDPGRKVEFWLECGTYRYSERLTVSALFSDEHVVSLLQAWVDRARGRHRELNTRRLRYGLNEEGHFGRRSKPTGVVAPGNSASEGESSANKL